MPFIAVAPADARQVRPGALAAPLERMVVDELAGHGVVAVAFGLGAERPDHLRVAVVATLADVDVAPDQLQGVVGLETRHRLGGGSLEEQRHDFHQAAHAYREHDQEDHQTDVLFDRLMVHFFSPVGIGSQHQRVVQACASEPAPWPAALITGASTARPWPMVLMTL